MIDVLKTLYIKPTGFADFRYILKKKKIKKEKSQDWEQAGINHFGDFKASRVICVINMTDRSKNVL